MKTMVAVSMMALMATAAAPAQAGCVTGAVVGGVAGHLAHHHALLGAAAGCVVGHELAVRKKRELAAQRAGQAAAVQNGAPPPHN